MAMLLALTLLLQPPMLMVGLTMLLSQRLQIIIAIGTSPPSIGPAPVSSYGSPTRSLCRPVTLKALFSSPVWSYLCIYEALSGPNLRGIGGSIEMALLQPSHSAILSYSTDRHLSETSHRSQAYTLCAYSISRDRAYTGHLPGFNLGCFLIYHYAGRVRPTFVTPVAIACTFSMAIFSFSHGT